MGFEQRLGHQFQSGMTGNQLPDTFGERAFGGLADLQAKAPQHAAQAVLDVAQLRLQQLARRQNRTRLLRPGRNQPSRISCAIPRASLRSDFTGIALKASRTCRVSKSSTAKPASRRAAYSHCDKGPAS